jgi:hypothetical protein
MEVQLNKDETAGLTEQAVFLSYVISHVTIPFPNQNNVLNLTTDSGVTLGVNLCLVEQLLRLLCR